MPKHKQENEIHDVKRNPSILDSGNQALIRLSCGTFMKRVKFYKELEKEIKK